MKKQDKHVYLIPYEGKDKKIKLGKLETKIEITYEEGVVGVIPVFESHEAARKTLGHMIEM